MITVVRKDASIKDKQELELRGLSTDEKPTILDQKEIDNGTMFIEMDTGKIAYFDGSTNEWLGGTPSLPTLDLRKFAFVDGEFKLHDVALTEKWYDLNDKAHLSGEEKFDCRIIDENGEIIEGESRYDDDGFMFFYSNNVYKYHILADTLDEIISVSPQN